MGIVDPVASLRLQHFACRFVLSSIHIAVCCGVRCSCTERRRCIWWNKKEMMVECETSVRARSLAPSTFPYVNWLNTLVRPMWFQTRYCVNALHCWCNERFHSVRSFFFFCFSLLFLLVLLGLLPFCSFRICCFCSRVRACMCVSLLWHVLCIGSWTRRNRTENTSGTHLMFEMRCNCQDRSRR